MARGPIPRSRLAGEAAAAIRVARLKHRSVRVFADLLVEELGLPRLSRQAVYDWESGKTAVPSDVFLAAAIVSGVSISDLLKQAQRFAGDSTDFVVLSPQRDLV